MEFFPSLSFKPKQEVLLENGQDHIKIPDNDGLSVEISISCRDRAVFAAFGMKIFHCATVTTLVKLVLYFPGLRPPRDGLFPITPLLKLVCNLSEEFFQ